MLEEKVRIAREYLVPRQSALASLPPSALELSDDTLQANAATYASTPASTYKHTCDACAQACTCMCMQVAMCACMRRRSPMATPAKPA